MRPGIRYSDIFTHRNMSSEETHLSAAGRFAKRLAHWNVEEEGSLTFIESWPHPYIVCLLGQIQRSVFIPFYCLEELILPSLKRDWISENFRCYKTLFGRWLTEMLSSRQVRWQFWLLSAFIEGLLTSNLWALLQLTHWQILDCCHTSTHHQAGLSTERGI